MNILNTNEPQKVETGPKPPVDSGPLEAEVDPQEQMFNVLELVEDKVVAGSNPILVKCPHCAKESFLSRAAAYSDTQFSYQITLSEGHMLQAQTLGGVMQEIGRLTNSLAKNCGTKIQTLVKDVRFEGNTITVDFMTLRVGDKAKT